MSRYACGDIGAFETLYARHKAPLYRYIRRQISDSGAAEEVFQDVWTNLIRSRERYEARAKFATWLYRMAHNRVVDWYRAKGRNQEVSPNGELQDGDPWEPADRDAPDPDRRLAADRGVAQLRRALSRLPAEQREAFLLQEESGLSLEEIAKVTGVGRETVKSRLRYAVTKLRAAISWSGPEDPFS